MREVLYEDELDARARQQRALYLRHTVEDIEKKRLEFKDERLNNVIVCINSIVIISLILNTYCNMCYGSTPNVFENYYYIP